MENKIEIRKAGINDIAVIRKLAQAIWPDTYKEILSLQQIDYMLNLMYSQSSLAKQMDDGYIFLLAEENRKPIAFAAYNKLNEGVYKLQKIYVLISEQGKGIGKLLIDKVIDLIKKENANTLLLNVNRNNKAKQFYERLGFKIISEEDIDIGEGYFMNDYIMQKLIG